MKNSLPILGFLIFIAGCGQMTDEQIIQEAYDTHQAIAGRHVDLLNSHDNAAVVKNGTRFGLDYRSDSGFWGRLFDDDYRDIAAIAPLHRACFIIGDDLNNIRGHMSRLKAHMLENSAVYTNLKNLRENLSYAYEVMRDQKAFIEESRILEQRRIQQAQLEEARRQTRALQDIACKQQSPCCCS